LEDLSDWPLLPLLSDLSVHFDGWDANNTGWDSYDDQIYPNVPEPSTYGMIFMAACSALFAFKRFVGSVVVRLRTSR